MQKDMRQSKTKRNLPYYDYHPLQNFGIRLVAVEKATDANDIGEQLKIHFFSSTLSTCPPYTALSYTWDNPSPMVDPCTVIFTKVLRCYPVLCKNRIVLASRNLRDALRRIRQYQTFRANGEGIFERRNEPSWKILLERTYGATAYFWIDALCINQEDVHERSQQFSLMSRVYTQASHTMVWLGESDKYTEAAQSVLGKGTRNAGIEVSTSMDHESPPDERLDGYVGLKSLDTRCGCYKNVSCQSRVQVLLGDLCFNFELLLHAANVEVVNGRDYSFAKFASAAAKQLPDLESSLLSSKTVFNSIQNVAHTSYCREKIASGCLPDFLSVVTASRSLIATDPRDKIYAILGIVSELQSDNISTIVSDYKKQVEHVFVEVTFLVMQARKDLAVLSFASAGAATKALPSWCPDYSYNGKALRSIGGRGYTSPTGASWTHPPRIRLAPDLKLQVEGMCVDVVVESTSIGFDPPRTSRINDPGRLRFGIAEMLRFGIEARLAETLQRYPQSRVEILWRTIILDELQGVSPVGVKIGVLFPEFVEWLLMATISHHLGRDASNEQIFLSEVELHHYVAKVVSCLEMLVAMEPLNGTLIPVLARLRVLLGTPKTWRGIEATCSEALDKSFVSAFLPLRNATMARLRHFTLGLTQISVVPLDEVWILHGAHAPIFLRPTCCGQYQFLGDVYVHGIMHGEVVSIFDPLASTVLE